MVQLNTPSIFGAWQQGENAAFQQKQKQLQLLALEQKRQAQQAAAQREAKLREAIVSGIDPSTPEGLNQLLRAGLATEDYFKAIDTQSKVKLAGIKGEAAQRTADAAEMRARAAERTAAAREKQVLGQLRINAAQLGISQQNANANYMRLRAAYDKDRAEALGQQAYNLQQLSPEQREPAYQIWRQQKIASGEFKESDLPTDYDEPIVTSIALGYANKHKGTGKPVAVIDPSTGQAVYVAPEQAIGKQPASKDGEGSFKEYQYKAAQYGQRMNSASENMKSFENPSVLEKAFQKSGILGNFAQTPERQMYYQAQREFINAIKRQESGAAVTDSEVEDYAQTYFPQPGDTPEVMQRKRQARERAIAGNKATAGGAWEEVGKAVSAVTESQSATAGGGQGGNRVMSFEEFMSQ